MCVMNAWSWRYKGVINRQYHNKLLFFYVYLRWCDVGNCIFFHNAMQLFLIYMDISMLFFFGTTREKIIIWCFTTIVLYTITRKSYNNFCLTLSAMIIYTYIRRLWEFTTEFDALFDFYHYNMYIIFYAYAWFVYDK